MVSYVLLLRSMFLLPMRIDDFWASLIPETALLARTFVEHCISANDTARLETSLPVVTALAFKLQAQYNAFLQLLDDASNSDGLDEDASEELEEKVADNEFIISELLQLAVHLDYADEIGRRKMFGIVRK